MKKHLNRGAAALLCVLALTIPASAVGETGYTDVPTGAWYEDAASYCRDSGLLQGTGGGRFSPEAAVTRSALAVVLWRWAGTPQVISQTAFVDVPESAWYAPAIRWASQSGVMGGTGGGIFAPGNPVTRQQLAAALWRLAGSPDAQAEPFADGDAISAYALTAVDYVHSAGLMSGRTDGCFGPDEPLTRAQLAQVLYHRAQLPGTVSQVSAIDVMCQPCGLAAMADGSLLVTDGYGKVIWQVTEGESALFAGADTVEDVYGQPVGGYHDGTLPESIFKNPWAVVPFLDGWAVSDPANKVVRFLRTGGKDEKGRTEVTDLGIKFDHPTGLAVDGEGNLYISDTFARKVLSMPLH